MAYSFLRLAEDVLKWAMGLYCSTEIKHPEPCKPHSSKAEGYRALESLTFDLFLVTMILLMLDPLVSERAAQTKEMLW